MGKYLQCLGFLMNFDNLLCSKIYKKGIFFIISNLPSNWASQAKKTSPHILFSQFKKKSFITFCIHFSSFFMDFLGLQKSSLIPPTLVPFYSKFTQFLHTSLLYKFFFLLFLSFLLECCRYINENSFQQ